jgi:hypothetical protein
MMPLTDAGRNHIATDLNGEAVTEFNNANANLGVGNSNAAFNKAQTDLQGGSTLRKGMDATFPSRATNVITAKSTFLPAEANFAWEEWGYFNAGAAGTMLNRKVESLGTKPPTQTWILTATLTINNP